MTQETSAASINPEKKSIPTLSIPPLRQNIDVGGIAIPTRMYDLTTYASHDMSVLDVLNTIERCRAQAEVLLATADSLQRLLEFTVRPVPDYEALARAAGWDMVEIDWRGEQRVRRESDYRRWCEKEGRIPDYNRDKHEYAKNWEAACRRDKLCEFFEPTPPSEFSRMTAGC
jgi:hypothetical protein